MGRLHLLFMAVIDLACDAARRGVGGRWNWWERWALAVVFVAYRIGTGLWVVRFTPGLSSEHVRAVARPGRLSEPLNQKSATAV
jgi:hypothetical protein